MQNPIKVLLALVVMTSLTACNDDKDYPASTSESVSENTPSAEIQVGPRPAFLVNDMEDGELKTALQACESGPFYKTDFSIGHRGAPMQFPEHTEEAYTAAAKMGAGIVECDVTFTKDRELVCRHSQCDLHTTTNILSKPDLAAKCSVPFSPAAGGAPASVQCCTSDITLAEFKTLKGKMDGGNSSATTVEEYMDATASWRTDLYASRGTLLSHAESIELFKKLNVKMTPELKSASVAMPYEGDYTQEMYAQQMIEEYKTAGVDASQVWVQSFDLDDVKYWIANEPQFGMQAVYLDDRYGSAEDASGLLVDPNDPSTWSPTMEELAADNIKIIAPPMWMLVTLDGNNEIVPSEYAIAAKAAGLDIIAWSFERAGPLTNEGGWYYNGVNGAIDNDGDRYKMLDVLAKDVGIVGMFSDWPASVTYYANCMNL